VGTLRAGEAMQPPGPGREDSLADRQVFGTGISVLVDEDLMALGCQFRDKKVNLGEVWWPSRILCVLLCLS
jgi:hypothetical protein